MSDYTGLVAEVDAKTKIPDKQLEAIMTAYPSCWGYAAPFTNKQGVRKLQIATVKLPEGWSAKDIQDMKAQVQDGMPEMMEYFGKFPANIDDVCMQPFPLLENDKGNVTLCLFMEGDYDHWKKEDEENHTNLTPEYICYRDKIAPLILKLETQCRGDVNQIVKELADPVYRDILEGTFDNRGVMYFLAESGVSQLIEDQNDKRKDEDWGSVSNDIPEVPATEEVEIKEPEKEPEKELSLAEKRKLRQANADKAAQKTIEGVHATTTTSKPVNQATKSDLKSSTAAVPKGPFIFTLPKSITTEAEAKAYWQTNAGTCPDMWKVKQANGTWVPSHTAGFPYEKFAKNSLIREKYNADGTLKSSGKGFAALDDVATGKDKGPIATPVGPHPDAPRPGTAPAKIPVIPSAVRDKVLEELLKLDLKSRKILPNDEIKAAEAKHSTFLAQLKNIPREELWRLSYEEIDKLNRTYPDFGSGWIFALRSFEMQNYKPAKEPKKEETGNKTVQPEPELTLAQKRALRKKAAA